MLVLICQFVDRIKKELMNVIIIKEMNEKIISFNISFRIFSHPLVNI